VRSRRKGRVMIQTGLRLEAEILDRLRSGKLGLSDEIRDRLERTFREDGLDPNIRELCDALLNLAERVRTDFGDWHSSPSAHKAFVAAVTQRLAGYAPPPTPASPGPPGASDLFAANAEMLGQVREQDDRRQHSYPHLEAAAKRRAARQERAGKLHITTKKGDGE
jgi:hypothetical protein